MFSILLDTNDLKKEFDTPHHLQIVSVTTSEAVYIALFNVWKTDHYKDVQQVVVCFKESKIMATYKDIHEKGSRWQCIYGLEGGKYWLGGNFSRLDSGAKMSLFKENHKLYTRAFDKGYSTEITNIESSNNNAIVIKGNWYECVRAGGHDDFFPVRWETKILKDGKDFIEEENPVINQSYFSESMAEPYSENFYVLEQYGISKYSVEGRLLWNQGLGHIGQEELMPLNRIAPYYKIQNEDCVADGVWFSGMDLTPPKRSLGKPLLGRITANGTILSFTHVLQEFPETYKIHSIVPGMNGNCLLIGDTIRIGEGIGLFFLHLHFANGVCNKHMQYGNFNSADLKFEISDTISFHERYLDIKGVYPQSTNLEDLTEIIIFGNVDYGINRDNGMVWSIKINFLD